MSFKEILRQQQRGVEFMGNVGVIGLHMVSGPLVGFGIGYGLDYWLDTGPWLKLVFLFVGIGAGFLNVYTDSQRLLRRMNDDENRRRAARREDASAAEDAQEPPAETAARAGTARTLLKDWPPEGTVQGTATADTAPPEQPPAREDRA